MRYRPVLVTRRNLTLPSWLKHKYSDLLVVNRWYHLKMNTSWQTRGCVGWWTCIHHTMAKARTGQRSHEGQCEWMPGPKSFNTNKPCIMQTSHIYSNHHIKISSHPTNCITSALKPKTHHRPLLMSWSAAKPTQLWYYVWLLKAMTIIVHRSVLAWWAKSWHVTKARGKSRQSRLKIKFRLQTSDSSDIGLWCWHWSWPIRNFPVCGCSLGWRTQLDHRMSIRNQHSLKSKMKWNQPK